MKQRIMLLVGLTAVSLLILLTSCTTSTTPEAIVATAVPATPTSQPTATTAPTATPEPTPTPTAAEQANQLLLNNGRFTALLAELTQEIGRDLSDAEQAQLLALARALWQPGQTDASDWLPDPAGVTLHWRPALDGREGPVLRVVETQPDSPYAAGVVIFWQGERLLTLTPSQPGFNIMYDQGASTWVETDTNGQLIRFVDNTNPDSHTYLKWVIPQDQDEDGNFSIFKIQDTDPNNGDATEFWWTNGGEPVRITTAPPDANAGESFTDYLERTNKSIQTMTIDGQEYLAIIDAAGLQTEHRYNHDTGEWEVFEVSAVNLAEAVEQLRTQGVNMIHESINLAPTDTMPGFGLSATERLYTDMEQIVAVVTNEDVVRRGLQYVHDTNRTNNPDAPTGHSLFRTVNPVTGQLETTAVPHNATVNVHMMSGLEPVSTGLVPFYFGPSSSTVRYGLHFNELTNSLNIIIQMPPGSSTDAGVGSQPHALWERVLAVFGSMTNQVSRMPQQGGNVTSITTISEGLRDALKDDLSSLKTGTGIYIFNNTTYLQHWSNKDRAGEFHDKWGQHQTPYEYGED